MLTRLSSASARPRRCTPSNGLCVCSWRLTPSSQNPARCPVILEAEELGFSARHLLYGKGRGLYRIIRHPGGGAARSRPSHLACFPRCHHRRRRGGVTMPDFIAYYRVSTDRQGASGLGLEAQRAAVLRHINTGPLVAEYTEVESGKKHTNRPQLLAALQECRRRKATLLIAKLDRLGRNVAFISALMESGAEFVCCAIPTPTGSCCTCWPRSPSMSASRFHSGRNPPWPQRRREA